MEGSGAPIGVGGVIQPASLLQPADTASDYSITILLPDGQHVLYECFTAADCARGFRVPSLFRKPDAFAVEMLARIRAVLSGRQHDLSNGDRNNTGSQAVRDEAVAELDVHNRIQIAGQLTALPAGHYTYDLHPLNLRIHPSGTSSSRRPRRPIDLEVPAPGLYDITISDPLSTPRIEFSSP